MPSGRTADAQRVDPAGRPGEAPATAGPREAPATAGTRDTAGPRDSTAALGPSRPAAVPHALEYGFAPIRPRPGALRVARQRMLERRRRTAVILVLLLTTGMVVLDLARGDLERRELARAAQARSAAAPVATPTATGLPVAAVPKDRDTGSPANALRFPVTGPGAFAYAAGPGPVLGAGGRLRRFKLAAEQGAGQDPSAFAAAVDRVFADPRGWTASRQLRLQRVPRAARAEFTIFLATPGTSEKMCATGGLHTERFTSCRLPGQVIINLARWWQAVPGYGAPLAEYQAYAINHEVGHQLGFGHEACPRAGGPAPVMQQQTFGLRGCRANGWPYIEGRRYAGPRIP